MDWMLCPLKIHIYVEVLTLVLMVLEDGGLWEVIKCRWGWSCGRGISARTKWGRGARALFPWAFTEPRLGEHTGRAPICKPASRPSPNTESAGTTILDLPVFWTVKNKATQSAVFCHGSWSRLRQLPSVCHVFCLKAVCNFKQCFRS